MMITQYQTGRRSLLKSPTIILILANLIVFAITSLGGENYLILLAQVGELFYQGYYWQIFTSMFVHFGILHILFNMYGLFYFGRLNEMNFSVRQYLAIYFGAGLLGNVMSLILIPPNVPAGGASGAIFGLLGSYVSIERRANNMVMGLLYAFLIFVQSSGPGVNIFAHLFGLLAGLALGFLFTTTAKALRRYY
jgi:rhomboid protease GluP